MAKVEALLVEVVRQEGGVMRVKAHAALFPVLKRSVIKDAEASDHCAVTVALDGTHLGLGAAD